MSLYKKAGLVQIPSGYKADKLYSVVPNNGDGDFDFTRASTATRVNKDGLIETVAINQARLDYPLLDGVVQDNPALLLEPSRGNIYTYSEDLSQGTTLTNTTVDADSITSPDGALTGNKLTQTSGSLLRKTLTSLSGTYAWSFFAKKGNLRYLNARSLFVLNGTAPANGNTIIDLDTNTIAYKGTNVTSASIQQYPNDWIKVEIVATDNATGSADSLDFFFTDNATSTQSLGVAGNGYIWGIQFESGNYGTSYIPNLITGSTSRSADICNGAGTANDFNDSEGVLYAEIAKDSTGVDGAIAISDSSYTNRVLFYFDTAGNIRAYIYASGEQARIDTSGLDYTNNNKIALKYSTASTKFYVNGFQVGITDTSSTMPTGLSELAFDDGGGGSDFYGKTKELMTFKEALSDIELETLTSYRSFNEMATEQLYTIQ